MEFLALRPKCYLYKFDGTGISKKAKGVKNMQQKGSILYFDDYKKVLEDKDVAVNQDMVR